jgi:hypothetical protein
VDVQLLDHGLDIDAERRDRKPLTRRCSRRDDERISALTPS